MTLETSVFASTAHALAATLRRAKETGEKIITIPQDTYHVYADEASAPVVCVANHGYNGYKSAALAIEGMADLTVDGGGSTFILHGCMDFAIVKNSQNITIRNLTVTCADTCNFQGKVTEAAEGCVTVELEEHPKLYLFGDVLFQKIDHQMEMMGRTLDYVTETGEIRRGSGDENFGVKFKDIRKTLEGDTLRLYDVPVMPPVGDTIVFTMSRRCNQAFLLDRSENVTLENVTVHTCWGMGVIAQKCKDVTIRRCSVTPDEGRLWSAGQDATHFVNCRGKILIEDCLFENQLDDAANLHGIYTLIEKVADSQILVRYAHFQTRGIDIYSVGDAVQIMDRQTQQPTAFARIAAVEVLNPDMTILTLTDVEGEILPGMIVENLSDEADVLIRNNVIRNNRARGMLIAAKGKVEITGNRFHSGGAAIQFESDPIHWFECGGTTDVQIRDNFFDDCRHGTWGRAVIDICKRKKEVDGFYYHGTVAITGNRFTQKNVPCVWADNVGNLIVKDNDHLSDTEVMAAHSIVNGKTVE